MFAFGIVRPRADTGSHARNIGIVRALSSLEAGRGWPVLRRRGCPSSSLVRRSGAVARHPETPNSSLLVLGLWLRRTALHQQSVISICVQSDWMFLPILAFVHPLSSSRDWRERIINISFGTSRVEGGGIWRRERKSFLESIYQVWVGNVKPAE